MNPTELAKALKDRALAAGADLAGVAPAEPAGDAEAYQAWLDSGMHGTMAWMERNAESRRDIRAWYAPARSVLVCAFSYGEADRRRSASDRSDGRVARYARRPDYHDLLKGRMTELLAWVKERVPGAEGLPFCDTSPLLERWYARRAGLGWQGKNVMMIGPRLGSYHLLAGLALSVELPSDEPEADHCGTCTRCIDACPTGAFPRERVLDASKCIAYHTIESRGPVPEPLRPGFGGWVFGCDVCQDVCPWNRFERPGRVLPPPVLPPALDLEELAALDEAAFKARFRGLPVSRAKRKGLLRSVLLAMGNSGQPRFRETLRRFVDDPDPVLSEQARWSLRSL